MLPRRGALLPRTRKDTLSEKKEIRRLIWAEE
jgi:hypothetical protein